MSSNTCYEIKKIINNDVTNKNVIFHHIYHNFSFKQGLTTQNGTKSPF